MFNVLNTTHLSRSSR